MLLFITNQNALFMQMIYTLTLRSDNKTNATTAMLDYFQAIKDLPVFPGVVSLGDNKSKEFTLLAVSIEVNNESEIESLLEPVEQEFIQRATEAGIIVKTNRYQASIASDPFLAVLKNLSHAIATV